MSATYPKPETPLPWDDIPLEYADIAYALDAANAFPHLVAALEAVDASWQGRTSIKLDIEHALAIARGEVTP